MTQQQRLLEEGEVRLMLGVWVYAVRRVALGCNRQVVELRQEDVYCQEQEEVTGYYTRVAVDRP
jgi:hypothetical protein